jgi:hypothetical protein
MNPSRALVLGAVLTAVTSAASGQSYGSEPQRLMIGAAEFRPVFSTFELYLGQDGYVSLGASNFRTAPPHYFLAAQISLPEGAVIEKFCLWAYDTDLDDEVTSGLVAAKLAPAGEESDLKFIDAGASSEGTPGYRRYCNDVSVIFRGKLDIDGDGTLDDAAYYVESEIGVGDEIQSRSLGGVEIIWRRAVSPAPSEPTFSDVATSHPFYPFIEALAASNITGGCGDGSKYCPDAALTRGQMAVFLAKALGLHWVE